MIQPYASEQQPSAEQSAAVEVGSVAWQAAAEQGAAMKWRCNVWQHSVEEQLALVTVHAADVSFACHSFVLPEKNNDSEYYLRKLCITFRQCDWSVIENNNLAEN